MRRNPELWYTPMQLQRSFHWSAPHLSFSGLVKFDGVVTVKKVLEQLVRSRLVSSDQGQAESDDKFWGFEQSKYVQTVIGLSESMKFEHRHNSLKGGKNFLSDALLVGTINSVI